MDVRAGGKVVRRVPAHTWLVLVMHEWSLWLISDLISLFHFWEVFVDTTYIEVCGLRNFKKSLMHASRATIHKICMWLIAWRPASAPDPNKVVGHLPNERTCFTWFIIAHGAVATVWVMSPKYRRLPLIRGGLETMATSDENKQALVKYSKSVSNQYEEPVVENFRDYTNSILAGIGVDDD